MSSPSPLAGLDVSRPPLPASYRKISCARARLTRVPLDCAPSARACLQASLLVTTKTAAPRTVPAANTLVFGQTFTDHMLCVPWRAESGWGTPELKAYGPLSLDPACTVLHYSPTLFEGMKAYKDKNGNARLFRPNKVSCAAEVGRPVFRA